MYVCICNGYRDSELRELASSGVSCAIEAYRTLGSGPCCGRCVPVAQQIIDETLGPPLAPPLSAAAE
ncbi:MAG: bacterioferritin-associated ferredoxin [Kiloniellales bacterium]